MNKAVASVFAASILQAGCAVFDLDGPPCVVAANCEFPLIEQCVDGRCIPLGPTDGGDPDAGPDAELPDAGHPDAGPADAGPPQPSDGGAVDGGLDAGSFDAGGGPRVQILGPLALFPGETRTVEGSLEGASGGSWLWQLDGAPNGVELLSTGSPETVDVQVDPQVYQRPSGVGDQPFGLRVEVTLDNGGVLTELRPGLVLDERGPWLNAESPSAQDGDGVNSFCGASRRPCRNLKQVLSNLGALVDEGLAGFDDVLVAAGVDGGYVLEETQVLDTVGMRCGLDPATEEHVDGGTTLFTLLGVPGLHIPPGPQSLLLSDCTFVAEAISDGGTNTDALLAEAQVTLRRLDVSTAGSVGSPSATALILASRSGQAAPSIVEGGSYRGGGTETAVGIQIVGDLDAPAAELSNLTALGNPSPDSVTTAAGIGMRSGATLVNVNAESGPAEIASAIFADALTFGAFTAVVDGATAEATSTGAGPNAATGVYAGGPVDLVLQNVVARAISTEVAAATAGLRGENGAFIAVEGGSFLSITSGGIGYGALMTDSRLSAANSSFVAGDGFLSRGLNMVRGSFDIRYTVLTSGRSLAATQASGHSRGLHFQNLPEGPSLLLGSVVTSGLAPNAESRAVDLTDLFASEHPVFVISNVLQANDDESFGLYATALLGDRLVALGNTVRPTNTGEGTASGIALEAFVTGSRGGYFVGNLLMPATFGVTTNGIQEQCVDALSLNGEPLLVADTGVWLTSLPAGHSVAQTQRMDMTGACVVEDHATPSTLLDGRFPEYERMYFDNPQTAIDGFHLLANSPYRDADRWVQASQRYVDQLVCRFGPEAWADIDGEPRRLNTTIGADETSPAAAFYDDVDCAEILDGGVDDAGLSSFP